MRRSQAGEKTTYKERLITDQAWIATGSESGVGALTDSPQPEPPTCAEEEPPCQDGRGDNQVDQ
jgi:hypothetical protein